MKRETDIWRQRNRDGIQMEIQRRGEKGENVTWHSCINSLRIQCPVFWSYSPLNSSHICPLYLHRATHCSFLPWSPVCVTLLLRVRPALECGQASKGRIIKQRWLFSQKLANANSSSGGVDFSPSPAPAPIHAWIWPGWNLCRPCACCHNYWELICAADCWKRMWSGWYLVAPLKGWPSTLRYLLCFCRLNCVMRWWWKMAQLIFYQNMNH